MNRYLALSALVFSTLWPASELGAIGWDQDDFIITGGNNKSIGVYDNDLTFKGFLDTPPGFVGGLDFDSMGRLVSVSQNREVRVYASTGEQVSSFTNHELGTPLDLSVGPNGNYYIATQGSDSAGAGLIEFDVEGKVITKFDAGAARAAVVLPNNMLWGGGDTNFRDIVNVFSTTTGELTGTVTLGTSRQRPRSMRYSHLTDTVLISTGLFQSPKELTTDGTIIRTFQSDFNFNLSGLTRGPGGDVFVTSTSNQNPIYRWTATGEFLGATYIPGNFTGISNIIWAGSSVPEPNTLFLAAIIVFSLMLDRNNFW